MAEPSCSAEVAVGLTRCVCCIASPQPSVQQYMARAGSIETLLETHGSSGSTAVAIPPAALVTREEEVVLATSQQFEHSAVLLQQLQALLPVLDQKWPLDGQWSDSLLDVAAECARSEPLLIFAVVALAAHCTSRFRLSEPARGSRVLPFASSGFRGCTGARRARTLSRRIQRAARFPLTAIHPLESAARYAGATDRPENRTENLERAMTRL